jgi:hypothetical protein
MSSAAESAAVPPASPRPSIFISYASQDRTAARLLRDALAAAGLEVWYDENELGGGDAWDQKIRRQIRECTYFMPVVSAQTEARREGYFRREWRLAVDRSHDMADDVMFLIPVVIDATAESGARVPEKFLTLQWLRLPGGAATPALTALAGRLARGDHLAPAPARPASAAARASLPPRPLAAEPPPGPPPISPFPPLPRSGGLRAGLKYIAVVGWWLLHAAIPVFKRLPKVARVLLTIWVVFMLVTRCSRDAEHPASARRKAAAEKAPAEAPATPTDPANPRAETAAALQDAATQLRQTARENADDAVARGVAPLGAEAASALAKKIPPPPAANPAAPLQVYTVPFALGVADERAAKFAESIHNAVFARLALTFGPRLGIEADPLATTAALQLAHAQTRGAAQLLSARLETSDDATTLVVRLVRVATGVELWSGSYPVRGGDPDAAAKAVAEAVLAAQPKS